MQLLFHIPDALAVRFKQAVPARQRSAFVAKLLEKALPVEEDPLYLAALEVEQNLALGAEMREWREGLIADGLRGIMEAESDDAAR
ncbi:MAG: hypothetical protein LBI88_05785 [Deltaproteobacteria bacterium]|jgi:hypothetical protein|nr:hypothetical protein [Deltaproteobacteria bacterium]